MRHLSDSSQIICASKPVCLNLLDGRVAEHPSGTFAESDAHRILALAPGAQRHLVAVLQEAASFAVRQLDGLLPALADLEQRAEAAAIIRGERSSADQVARLQVAAVAAVMGDDLRCAPIHRSVRGTA